MATVRKNCRPAEFLSMASRFCTFLPFCVQKAPRCPPRRGGRLRGGPHPQRPSSPRCERACRRQTARLPASATPPARHGHRPSERGAGGGWGGSGPRGLGWEGLSSGSDGAIQHPGGPGHKRLSHSKSLGPSEKTWYALFIPELHCVRRQGREFSLRDWQYKAL